MRYVTPTMPGKQADELGVDLFAREMKAKLKHKRTQGRGGWNRPSEVSTRQLRELLRKHLSKGDMVDVANFAMMVWNRVRADDAGDGVRERE